MASSPTEPPNEAWRKRFCHRLLQLRPEDDPDKCLDVIREVWANVFLLAPETAAEMAAEALRNKEW